MVFGERDVTLSRSRLVGSQFRSLLIPIHQRSNRVLFPSVHGSWRSLMPLYRALLAAVIRQTSCPTSKASSATPIQPQAGPMPTHNRSGCDQDEALLPSGPPPQHDPEQLIYGGESSARPISSPNDSPTLRPEPAISAGQRFFGTLASRGQISFVCV